MASDEPIRVRRRLLDAEPRGLVLIGLLVLGAALELALLLAWQRNADWGFSGGVYADSAREFLHGLVPYRDFAAAQPPPAFLFGALLLAVGDTAHCTSGWEPSSW